MRYPGLHTISLLVIFICLSAPSLGQNLASEQQKLLEEQRSIIETQNAQQTLIKKLEKAKSKISSLEAEVAPFLDAMNKAKTALDDISKATRATPTEENNARMKNAEFKYVLAERKYLKAAEQLQESKAEIARLETEIEDNKNKIAQANLNIEKQQSRIQWLEKKQQEQAALVLAQKQQKQLQAEQSRQAEEEQRRIAEEQRKEAELINNRIALSETRAEKAEADQEIARLTALLKDQQAAKTPESALPATSPSVNSTAQITQPGIASVSASSSQNQLAVNAPDSATASRPNTNAAATNSPSASIQQPLTAVAAKLSEEQVKAQAREQYQAYEQRAARVSSREKRSATNKVIHMKTLAGGEVIKSTSHSLSYYGEDLYQAKIEVRAGENIFSVGQRQWQIDIPASDDNTEYLIYYDTRDEENPDFVWYKRSDIQ